MGSAGDDAMIIGVSGFVLFWSASFAGFPSGRYPNSEVAAAAAVVKMGRLDYSIPTPGKDELEEGAGDLSAYFLMYRSRGDESSSAPLVSTNTESLSARLRRRLGCKAVCTGTFKEKNRELLKKCCFCQLKCLTYSLKPLIQGENLSWTHKSEMGTIAQHLLLKLGFKKNPLPN